MRRGCDRRREPAGKLDQGLELLGTAGFSLERALAPFNPKLRAASVRSPQADWRDL